MDSLPVVATGNWQLTTDRGTQAAVAGRGGGSGGAGAGQSVCRRTAGGARVAERARPGTEPVRGGGREAGRQGGRAEPGEAIGPRSASATSSQLETRTRRRRHRPRHARRATWIRRRLCLSGADREAGTPGGGAVSRQPS